MERSEPDLFDPVIGLAPAAPREIYTVARLNREVRALLENGFPAIWIEGEISNLRRPPSGHLYFSLKDDQAQVNCVLFRSQQRLLGIEPRDGLHVLMRARVSLYEGRGEFQLVVEYLEPAGEGARRHALEALKRRLAQEGLFDRAHKKPLPRLPRRIGLITSPAGAVLHDILTTLARRFPAIPVLLYPVPVQGEGAAERIAAMIRLAGERRDCDALILARGGGSLEDLWAFNEEIVARAIYDCPIPIVCGVGHETDVTIADLVADARAPTPTAAAELLSPDGQEWLARFRGLEQRLIARMRDRLRQLALHCDWLTARLVHPRRRLDELRSRLGALQLRLELALRERLRRQAGRLQQLVRRLEACAPLTRLRALTQQCERLHLRLVAAMHQGLERRRARWHAALQALHVLSPLATLARGYAIVTRLPSGELVRAARDCRPGDRVRARLAQGELDCLVEEARETQDEGGGRDE